MKPVWAVQATFLFLLLGDVMVSIRNGENMTLIFGTFERYQAGAPETIPLLPNSFEDGGETAVYWLSASGVLVNSHGLNIMIDPLLSIISDDPAIGETAEMLMTAPPIMATQVEKLDAVLYTHTDNDHLGPITAKELMKTGAQFHGTPYADLLLYCSETGLFSSVVKSWKRSVISEDSSWR
jgi:hypothetical protein